MLVYRTFRELRKFLDQKTNEGLRVGFVATMGALHQGHVSLVEKSNEECEISVVSIFVNPTQFNAAEDLEKYPRTEEEDLAMLKACGTHAVLMPSVEEVYPPGLETPNVDLKGLDVLMEGEFRPGHFAGVVQVVGRFFDQIKPDRAYFGEKDFQQLLVIQEMAKVLNSPVKVVGCEILREESGLAMSSRNLRLSKKAIENATIVIEQLNWIKDNFQSKSVEYLKSHVAGVFSENPDFELEYLELVTAHDLLPVQKYEPNSRVFMAAIVEGVRLIDNISIS